MKRPLGRLHRAFSERLRVRRGKRESQRDLDDHLKHVMLSKRRIVWEETKRLLTTRYGLQQTALALFAAGTLGWLYYAIVIKGDPPPAHDNLYPNNWREKDDDEPDEGRAEIREMIERSPLAERSVVDEILNAEDEPAQTSIEDNTEEEEDNGTASIPGQQIEPSIGESAGKTAVTRETLKSNVRQLLQKGEPKSHGRMHAEVEAPDSNNDAVIPQFMKTRTSVDLLGGREIMLPSPSIPIPNTEQPEWWEDTE